MMDQEPDYAFWDGIDPDDDPVVILERLLDGIISDIETLEKFAIDDRMLVWGSLPSVHEAYTKLGLILMQYPNILPQQAAE